MREGPDPGGGVHGGMPGVAEESWGANRGEPATARWSQDQGFALGEDIDRVRHLCSREWGGAWWRCEAEGLDPLATPKSFAAWWGDTSQEFHLMTQ